MQENAENEGKTTSRAEKCNGGSRKKLGQKRTFKDSQRAVGESLQNIRKDLPISKQATRLPHKTKVREPETRLQKTRIPTAGSVFLKCPFNGKAGLVFFNARHDDSGPRRSIFAEKPRKTASVKGIANSKGAERHRY